MITAVRFLTGTIALVYLDAALTGFAAPPVLIPTEPGVLRTAVTLVVIKRAGEWQILSQHMTPIPPAS